VGTRGRVRKAQRTAAAAIGGQGTDLPADPDQQIDQRLSRLASPVLAGDRTECAWELFRLQYFPGWKPADIAGALGAWSRRHAINVQFEIRKAHNVDTIYMVFTRLV
jgi:hypothetical protein